MFGFWARLVKEKKIKNIKSLSLSKNVALSTLCLDP
jgi:hypothetical protein